MTTECCHRTRLRDAPCPAGLVCPHDTAAALARLRAWVRSEAEGADLPEHYPQTHRGMMDVERLVKAVEELFPAGSPDMLSQDLNDIRG